MSIKASHSGTCPDCGGRWQPGDQICSADYALPFEQRRRPTVWRHVVCPDDDPLVTEHPVCQTCWLTHPEGACEYDEGPDLLAALARSVEKARESRQREGGAS